MKRGFTMTEMLVVLGIIAVIAGIGTPVTVHLVNEARRSACLTNLSGIGGALDNYLRDHGGRLPVMEPGRRSKKGEPQVMDVVLMPYVGSEKLFRCPSGVHEFNKTGCSYFWNSALNGSMVRDASFLGMRNSPESIPLVTDKEAWHAGKTNILYADGSASDKIRFTIGKELREKQ